MPSPSMSLFVCVQPVAGLHASSVQAFPSSQLRGLPTQAPPLHASPVVQALPSLHGAVLFVWVQPVEGLHPSSVQALPSSQLRSTHRPPHGQKTRLNVAMPAAQLRDGLIVPSAE